MMCGLSAPTVAASLSEYQSAGTGQRQELSSEVEQRRQHVQNRHPDVRNTIQSVHSPPQLPGDCAVLSLSPLWFVAMRIASPKLPAHKAAYRPMARASSPTHPPPSVPTPIPRSAQPSP